MPLQSMLQSVLEIVVVKAAILRLLRQLWFTSLQAHTQSASPSSNTTIPNLLEMQSLCLPSRLQQVSKESP
jgi:hypothetical protein